MTRIIIRAVLSRAAYIEYLRAKLPAAEFCFDQHRDARETCRRAMAMAGDGPAIHMEDDAILTRDFVAKAEAVIAAHPDRVIQFFSRRKKDVTVGSRLDRSFSANVCYYLPAGYSREVLAWMPGWAAAHPEHRFSANDLALNDWLRARREPHWIHVPSLVQHRIAPSAIDPRRAWRRVSATFEDADE